MHEASLRPLYQIMAPALKAVNSENFVRKFDISHQTGSALNHKANAIAE